MVVALLSDHSLHFKGWEGCMTKTSFLPRRQRWRPMQLIFG
jgi:hypothetical protein